MKAPRASLLGDVPPWGESAILALLELSLGSTDEKRFAQETSLILSTLPPIALSVLAEKCHSTGDFEIISDASNGTEFGRLLGHTISWRHIFPLAQASPISVHPLALFSKVEGLTNEARSREAEVAIVLPIGEGSEILGALLLFAQSADDLPSSVLEVLSALVDITALGWKARERRRITLEVSKELTFTEQVIKAGLDDGPLGVLLYGPDLDVIDCNKTMEDMTNMTKAELIGTYGPAIFMELDSNELAALKSASSSPVAQGYARRARRLLGKSNSPRHVVTSVSAVYSQSGDLAYHLSLVQDIEQRFQSYLKLNENLMLLRASIGKSPILLATFNHSGEVLIEEGYLGHNIEQHLTSLKKSTPLSVAQQLLPISDLQYMVSEVDELGYDIPFEGYSIRTWLTRIEAMENDEEGYTAFFLDTTTFAEAQQAVLANERRNNILFELSKLAIPGCKIATWTTAVLRAANESTTDCTVRFIGIESEQVNTSVEDTQHNAPTVGDESSATQTEQHQSTSLTRSLYKIVGLRDSRGYLEVRSRRPPSPDEEDFFISIAAMTHAVLLRAEHETVLTSHAMLDHVTGLGNREALRGRLLEQKSSDGATMLVVTLISVRNIAALRSEVNYEMGDKLCAALASRLVDLALPHGFAYSLSPEEFLYAQPLSNYDVTPSEASKTQGQTLLSILGKPLDIEGIAILPSLSIDNLVASVTDLTDIEIHQTMDFNRSFSTPSQGHSHGFDLAIRQQGETNLPILTDLNWSLRAGHFEVLYLPCVDTTSNQICTLDAKIVWNHPGHGKLNEEDFISSTIGSGVNIVLEDLKLDDIRSIVTNPSLSGIRIPIGVGVTPISLLQSRQTPTLLALQELTLVQRACVAFEYSELYVHKINPTVLTNITRDLRIEGFSVILDDLGSGFSSLALLRNLHLTHVKLAKSFIVLVPFDKVAASSVATMVSLVKDLGLSVIAKGVDSKMLSEKLIELGCTHQEGPYHYREVNKANLDRLPYRPSSPLYPV